MAIYLWSGKDRSGSKQKGEIEADNLPLARQMVIKKGITIKDVRLKPKALGDYFPAMAAKIKDKDIVIFVRQFATMIDAGLPLVQCMEILQEQQDEREFQKSYSTDQKKRRGRLNPVGRNQKSPQSL